MKRFAPARISFKANAKLFPVPLETVNSSINRIEQKEKHDKGYFNHGSPERVETITICSILIHG